jgi:PPOX class probable F420-dependent enzyme
MHLDDRVRAMLDSRSFAVLATLNADGSPQTSVIWVGRDDDVVLFTTHSKRQKTRNLRRDPRASLTVFAADDPYQTANIHGTVELVPDPDRALSIELTHRYLGEEPPEDPPGSERFVGRLTPERVSGYARA